MEKAIKILRDILACRDVAYTLTDNQIQDSIKERGDLKWEKV